MKRIPLRLVGMVMWIWRWYQDGMPLHTLYLSRVLWGCTSNYVDDGDPHDVDMESEDNNALDIYDDALVIAYLQACEILI
jgi:hypothetical protein